MAIHFACLTFDPFSFCGTSHHLTVVFGVGCAFVVAQRISICSQGALIPEIGLLWCLKVIRWRLRASKIVPPIMLSKAAIMLSVVSERGLQRTPRSKSDFAPGLVILRAVKMLKSAPCPCLVFGSRLVQNSWICTFSKDDGKMNFAIKTSFFDEIFLALTAARRILPFGIKWFGA